MIPSFGRDGILIVLRTISEAAEGLLDHIQGFPGFACRVEQLPNLAPIDSTGTDRNLLRELCGCGQIEVCPYDACEKKAARVNSLSLVRYRGNDYSVPTVV